MKLNEKNFSFFNCLKKSTCFCGSIDHEKRLGAIAIKEEKAKSSTPEPPNDRNTTIFGSALINDSEVYNKCISDTKNHNNDNLNYTRGDPIEKKTPPTPFNSPKLNSANLDDSIQLNNSFFKIKQNEYTNNTDTQHNEGSNDLNTTKEINTSLSSISQRSQNTSTFSIINLNDDFVEINQSMIKNETKNNTTIYGK